MKERCGAPLLGLAKSIYYTYCRGYHISDLVDYSFVKAWVKHHTLHMTHDKQGNSGVIQLNSTSAVKNG